MNLQLKDRRVLVTGSSRGIGRGIAEAFLAEKAWVAVSGRDRAALKNILAECKAARPGAELLCCAGDLTTERGIRGTLRKIVAAWGGLDVLVLNLGSGRSVPGLPDAAEWNRVLGLNLVAAMETLRQTVDLLGRGKTPSVVLVGSIAGLECLGAPMPYGAAKAALRHAMKEAARQLAGRGIRVNMVAPGNVWFPGGTWERKMAEDETATKAMLDSQVPLRRFGTVGEIASCVVFLASSRASFVTGACLPVDGGQTRS